MHIALNLDIEPKATTDSVNAIVSRERHRAPISMESNSPTNPSASPIVVATTPQRPLPRLPIEVWERAINWLTAYYVRFGNTTNDEFDLRRDLSMCALVCRAWRSRAQFHLFAHLRIEGDGLSQYETLLLKSPMLCGFAKEIFFINQYVEESKSKITNLTVETACHVVRLAHKLPRVHYLTMANINLAIENPNLSRHMGALMKIKTLDFNSPTPTKLYQLARVLTGLRNLSTLLLNIHIVVDPIPLPLPAPCYATKSTLTTLELLIQPGGHMLLDWLVKAKTFTTSLQILYVELEEKVPQSDIGLAMEGVQSLLDNCSESLKEWDFRAKVRVPKSSSVTQGNMVWKFSTSSVVR